MKKIFIFVIILLTLSFTGCKETLSLDVNYGESYTIENNKLDKYENLTWYSNDEVIASVNDQNEIIGNAPGTVVLVAKNNDKVVAEYTVNVTVIPITGVVLSTNSIELTVEEELQLHYTLFPENASDYGMIWKSADTSVAVVDDKGNVRAKHHGQTTISVSNENGIMATCSVTVIQKPAYERLTDKEKKFVDCVLKHIDIFKNPDSVVVKEIEKGGVSGSIDWTVNLSAMNGFGGITNEVYYLGEDRGFWEPIFETEVYFPDENYNIDLINEAINDMR